MMLFHEIPGQHAHDEGILVASSRFNSYLAKWCCLLFRSLVDDVALLPHALLLWIGDTCLHSLQPAAIYLRWSVWQDRNKQTIVLWRMCTRTRCCHLHVIWFRCGSMPTMSPARHTVSYLKIRARQSVAWDTSNGCLVLLHGLQRKIIALKFAAYQWCLE